MAKHDLAYTRGVALVDYGREVEQEIAKLQLIAEKVPELAGHYGTRWLAIKLLEQDKDILPKVEAANGGSALLAQAQKSIAHLGGIYGEDDVDVIIADRRYGFISGLIKEVVQRPAEDRLTISDKIDKIVTNRVLGIPIFLVAMWLVFHVAVNCSGPYLDWVDGVIGGPITSWFVAILELIGLGGSWVESLIVDGLIAGVGGVLVFVPVLLFLYLALAILEDSGYMARAAFVMDRVMHGLGLHGKSFLPMLIGFGCTVPAIYATRTLENEQDRKLTGWLAPFMSCGARLPVYTVFAAAFFPDSSGRFVFWLYVTGIALALLTGVIMKRTVFKGKPPAPFVMELPPYRMPTVRGIWTHMWERSEAFLRKATTIILLTSIIIWFLMNLPWGVDNTRDSFFGEVSAAIAPVFAPAGFGTWQAAGPLVTGFVAKEVVVGTMSQVYLGEAEEEEAGESTTFFEDVGGIVVGFFEAAWDTGKTFASIIPGVDLMAGEEEGEDTELIQALQGHFTPLSAVSFCVFILLYLPCMVVVAAQIQEYGKKWALFNALFLTVLGWVVSTLVYQGGVLFGFG